MKSIITAVALSLAAASTHAGEWTYQVVEDKMLNKKGKSATIQSDNSLSLNFPYNGKNHGQLTVMQHPKHGLNVIVSVDKGQILCSSLNDCTFYVKFGKEDVKTYQGNRAADGSSHVLFFRNPKKVIEKLRKHDTFKIQIGMFKEGEQVLEFTSPKLLSWQ